MAKTLSVKLNLSKIFIDKCTFFSSATTTDDYGQTTSPGSVQVDTADLPCKILSETRRAHEYKGEKKANSSYFTLFVMPLASNVEVTEQMWVVVNGKRYNIFQAPPPVCPGAPYELTLEQVRP